MDKAKVKKLIGLLILVSSVSALILSSMVSGHVAEKKSSTSDTSRSLESFLKIGSSNNVFQTVKSYVRTVLKDLFYQSNTGASQRNSVSIALPGYFLGGTQITMSDRSLKNIEDVQVGDIVLSYDVANGVFVNSQVTAVDEQDDQQTDRCYLVINGNINVMANHLLFINHRWLSAGKAKLDSCLFGVSGGSVVIEDIQSLPLTEPIYGIVVTPYHNYFASGILAHD